MDDHPVVWRAMQAMAQGEQDVTYVGHGERASDLRSLLESAQPDVLVLDVKLGEDDGLEAVAQAVAMRPRLRVLVFTAFGSAALVSRALGAGATGFLLKDSDFGTIVAAIRHVARGKSYIDPRLHGEAHGVSGPTVPGLTPREMDVLRMIVQGATDKEIAETLVISPHTVKYHTQNLKSKLDAHRRTDLVRRANELLLV